MLQLKSFIIKGKKSTGLGERLRYQGFTNFYLEDKGAMAQWFRRQYRLHRELGNFVLWCGFFPSQINRLMITIVSGLAVIILFN